MNGLYLSNACYCIQHFLRNESLNMQIAFSMLALTSVFLWISWACLLLFMFCSVGPLAAHPMPNSLVVL